VGGVGGADVNGFLHLIVHYLDDFRHDLAFTWVWTTWIGNISAGVVIFVTGSLFWPRLRRAFERFMDRKLKHHLAAHHNKMEAMVQHHLAAHLDAVKKHIDDSKETP